MNKLHTLPYLAIWDYLVDIVVAVLIYVAIDFVVVVVVDGVFVVVFVVFDDVFVVVVVDAAANAETLLLFYQLLK